MRNEVYALLSFKIYPDGTKVQDGYLLIPNKERVAFILEMAAANSESNKASTYHMRDTFRAHYEEGMPVVVNNYTADKVNTRGTFFVSQLQNCLLEGNVALDAEVIEVVTKDDTELEGN